MKDKQLTSPVQQPSPAHPAWIERIFQRMLGMYGSKFAEAWRGVPDAVVKETWAEALAGFTADEIKAGLNGCLQREWPPTLPEFIKLCRPAADYAVAYEIAHRELIARQSGRPERWTEAALYWAASRMSHDMGASSYEKNRARWKVELDRCREDVASGKLPNKVPEKPQEIQHESKPVSDEERAANIERLKNEIGDMDSDAGYVLTVTEEQRQEAIRSLELAIEERKKAALVSADKAIDEC